MSWHWAETRCYKIWAQYTEYMQYVLQKGLTSPTASYTLLQLCSVLNATKQKTLFVSTPEEDEQPFFVWIFATAIVSILLFSLKSQTTWLFLVYYGLFFSYKHTYFESLGPSLPVESGSP